eukprot:gene14893-biopygen197
MEGNKFAKDTCTCKKRKGSPADADRPRIKLCPTTGMRSRYPLPAVVCGEAGATPPPTPRERGMAEGRGAGAAARRNGRAGETAAAAAGGAGRQKPPPEKRKDHAQSMPPRAQNRGTQAHLKRQRWKKGMASPRHAGTGTPGPVRRPSGARGRKETAAAAGARRRRRLPPSRRIGQRKEGRPPLEERG